MKNANMMIGNGNVMSVFLMKVKKNFNKFKNHIEKVFPTDFCSLIIYIFALAREFILYLF